MSTFVSDNNKDRDDGDFGSMKTKKTKKGDDLTGMAKVNFVCRKKKARYDKCVSAWYKQDFMVGKSMDQEEACGDKFESYRECVLKGIRKEVWNEERWGPPGENSPLAEVVEDDDNNINSNRQ